MGWEGGAGGFLSGLREKALKGGRRKEQPAATKGFKGLGPLPNGLPQPSAAQRSQPGAWTPGPAPALRPRPFILGLPPGSAGQQGEGRGFPCSPGLCHPRREPGNSAASCPAVAGCGWAEKANSDPPFSQERIWTQLGLPGLGSREEMWITYGETEAREGAREWKRQHSGST